MKTSLFLLIILLFSWPISAFAEGICACYYGDMDTCAYSSFDSVGIELEDATDCYSYCDDTYDDALNNTDWADDADSEGGFLVSDACLESQESAEALSSATSSSSSTSSTSKLLTPLLSIDIPTVTFTDALLSEKEGRSYISVNYLGEYISGVYKYLIGISTTIAIVMIMISGLQWTFSGGSITGDDGKSSATKAKERIRNAVTGLVILLSTYVILYTVNPQLVTQQFPELQIIEAEGIHENEAEFVSGSVATSFSAPSSSNVYGKAKSIVPTDLVSDIEAVAASLESQGFGMAITSGYRSIEEQIRQIHAKCNNPPGSQTCDPKDGKTVACILRNNDPKNCPHTTGRALDIWGTKLGTEAQCITQSQCQPSLGANDPCRLNECQAALIDAMRAQGFCNLSSEAWHFEKPPMSPKCT